MFCVWWLSGFWTNQERLVLFLRKFKFAKHYTKILVLFSIFIDVFVRTNYVSWKFQFVFRAQGKASSNPVEKNESNMDNIPFPCRNRKTQKGWLGSFAPESGLSVVFASISFFAGNFVMNVAERKTRLRYRFSVQSCCAQALANFVTKLKTRRRNVTISHSAVMVLAFLKIAWNSASVCVK